jgi:hypothetical protein
MNAKTGDVVDHINRNKFDNRIQNLRFVNKTINAHNKEGRGSSIYRGVNFNKRDNNWKAAIMKERITYSVGVYEKEIQAAIAVNVKSKELYGDLASLNKISSYIKIFNFFMYENKKRE